MEEKEFNAFFSKSYLKIYKKFLNLSIKMNVTVYGNKDKEEKSYNIWFDYQKPGYYKTYGIEIKFNLCRDTKHDNGQHCFMVEFKTKYKKLKPSIIAFLKEIIGDKPILIYEPKYKKDCYGDIVFDGYKKIS